MTDDEVYVGRKDEVITDVDRNATVKVLTVELAKALAEVERLRARETELLRSNSENVEKWQQKCQELKRMKMSRDVYEKYYVQLAEKHNDNPLCE